MSQRADDDAPADDVVSWPDAEFELVLRKPIERKDGGTLSSIMLREPNGAEWETIMAHPPETRRRFSVSLVGGVLMADVAKIGIGDIVRGERYLLSFFEVGRATATE